MRIGTDGNVGVGTGFSKHDATGTYNIAVGHDDSSY